MFWILADRKIFEVYPQVSPKQPMSTFLSRYSRAIEDKENGCHPDSYHSSHINRPAHWTDKDSQPWMPDAAPVEWRYGTQSSGHILLENGLGNMYEEGYRHHFQDYLDPSQDDLAAHNLNKAILNWQAGQSRDLYTESRMLNSSRLAAEEQMLVNPMPPYVVDCKDLGETSEDESSGDSNGNSAFWLVC